MRKNTRYWACLAGVAVLAWFWQSAASQEPDERKPQKPQPAGVATGAPHAPVKDAMSRPITAGGFVDGAPIVFADITKEAGLDKFRHRSGSPEKDRKSTRLNSSHMSISYAVFCLKKKNQNT